MRSRSRCPLKPIYPFLFVFALTACTKRVPRPPLASDEFTAIQSQYFQRLDLRASPAELAPIPPFAARLSALADGERGKVLTGELTTAEQKARSGLIFVYDALMTMNNTDAAARGTLDLTALEKARRFSASATDAKSELNTRAVYVINELSMAASLRPDDKRIDSWFAAANADLERLRDGKMSDRAISAVLDTVAARPSFNLWTALLVMQNEDPSSPQFTRLLTAARTFVDGTAHGQDPCQSRPLDCVNGPNAPYNLQAASVILGDLFLRQAEYSLSKDDIPTASQMAGYADGIYAHLRKPATAATTAQWPDRDVMPLRDDRMDKIHQALPPPDSLLTNVNYQRVYECASCHGRAR